MGAEKLKKILGLEQVVLLAVTVFFGYGLALLNRIVCSRFAQPLEKKQLQENI